jgi:hypothetical protein
MLSMRKIESVTLTFRGSCFATIGLIIEMWAKERILFLEEQESPLAS